MSAVQRIYVGTKQPTEFQILVLWIAKLLFDQSDQPNSSTKLLDDTGNLPHSATAAQVLELLGLSIDQATVELATARENPAKKLGFGFVTVPLERVEAVLQCNGTQMGGRSIKVALARQSDQSKPKKWQKAPGIKHTAGAAVMHSKPQRGIPQDVLDKLQALRVRMERKKSEAAGEDKAQPMPSAKAVCPLPPLVDVGANLTNFRFKGDLEVVVERALAAGVHQIVVTGTGMEDSQMALLLAQSLPGVLFSTAGVHPHHAKHWTPACVELLEALLCNPQVIAVGETGLDYNRMFSSIAQQLDAFSAQVEIACKLGKSLFLHEREAHADLVRVLQRFKDNLPPVVVHCFTGTEAEAKRYIELGYYIGVTGFVCKAERGKEVRKLLKEGVIPLTRLVIETDAPFMLPPLPAKDYNGLDPRKRNNEPCTLPLLVKTLAEVYGVSEQEVAEQTTANAMKLFQLALA